jgi:hypothetical protein
VQAKIELTGLTEHIETIVARVIACHQRELCEWPYSSAEQTADLLQIGVKTLLDKRKGYLDQLEYSKQGKAFWFLKASILAFVEKRAIYKRFRGVELKRPKRALNIPHKA